MQGEQNLYVNDAALSWGSFEFKVDDEVINGIVGVNYDETLEVAIGYSAGPGHRPTHRSRGKVGYGPVKFKLYKKCAQALRRALAKKAGTRSYGQAEFEFTAIGTEVDEGTIDLKIHRLRYTKTVATFEEGPDLIMEEIECSTMHIENDDLQLGFEDVE